MQQLANDAHSVTSKVPWNKGKMIGAKPPLQTKHVWSIRTKLQMGSKTRDLALFNLAIDSKLRGGDVVHLVRRTLTAHFCEFTNMKVILTMAKPPAVARPVLTDGKGQPAWIPSRLGTTGRRRALTRGRAPAHL